jgi:hypothetical protein
VLGKLGGLINPLYSPFAVNRLWDHVIFNHAGDYMHALFLNKIFMSI